MLAPSFDKRGLGMLEWCLGGAGMCWGWGLDWGVATRVGCFENGNRPGGEMDGDRME